MTLHPRNCPRKEFIVKNALLLASCFAAALAAPTALIAQPIVSNLIASQRPSGDRAVDISYDLSGGNGPMTVSILVSSDNGATFSITPELQYLTGNVGSAITNGTGYAIVWDAMADVPEMYWPETRVRLIATEEGSTEPASLAITSSETAPVHQTANQTLTFTFDSAVTDFDASDVTVSGAAKGTFSGSGSVYTLALTGTGGKIDVAVAQNVVSPGNNAGAFSNFYQDTWTLSLPGAVPMELIRIPAGTFTMGSPVTELSRESDETEHTVTLTQDFYLGKTEVTQQQWLAVHGSWPGTAPSATHGVGNSFPAYNVSHNDIQTFMSALDTAITEPGTFGLPTESQWEYAARAGATTRFNFGDGFGADENCSAEAERTNNMWYCGNNSPNGTKAVGQKPANAWGLRDMHGNVWEWCADWYGTYPGTITDPTGPVSGSDRVIRGGSWDDGAQDCRSANRNNFSPANRFDYIGFRVLAVR
jgi:formylglycine-generating enzyme required for sulfatase activity